MNNYQLTGTIRGRFDFDKLKLTAHNPKFDNRKRFGGIGDKGLSPFINFFTEHVDGTVSVPRNYIAWDNCIDMRQPGKDIKADFSGMLRKEQEFLKDLDLDHDPLINAPCGFGKTISACYLISRVKKQTLIIAPTTFLLKQWEDAIKTFLPGTSYIIVSSSSDVFNHKDITIVTYPMCYKLKTDRLEHFGVVIADEVHRGFGQNWLSIFNKLPARVRIGLSATPYRLDNMHQYALWHFGAVYEVPNVSQPADLYFVRTNFTVNKKFVKGYYNTDNEVHSSKIRMDRVKFIIDACLKAGRKPIAIAKRKKPLQEIAAAYPAAGLLISDTLKKNPDIIEYIRHDAPLIPGISQLIKEGVDIQSADTLIIFSAMGDIHQIVGRVLRSFPDKKRPLVIYLKDDISIYDNTISSALDHTGHSEYKGEINWTEINTIL